jgi:hypothetical protein
MRRTSVLVARSIWWSALWFIRWRPIRRMRRLSWAMLPEPHSSRVRRSITRQDRVARRYGLLFVTLCVQFTLSWMFLASVLLACTVLYDQGVLTMPEEVVRMRFP